MVDVYFSEREGHARARDSEELSGTVWAAITTLFERLREQNAFAHAFPDACPDGFPVCETNWAWLSRTIEGELPDLAWPVSHDRPPGLLPAVDFIEFCHDHVSEPRSLGFHSYYGHSHFEFDGPRGQRDFRDKVNRIFARNGVAFQLQDDGAVVRISTPELDSALAGVSASSDESLDQLVSLARRKFSSPDPQVRVEALQTLWDAWERLKTVPGGNKSASVDELLKRAGLGNEMREVFRTEALTLTAIGNDFQIRHFETSRPPVTPPWVVDYLFHRMVALLGPLVRATISSASDGY